MINKLLLLLRSLGCALTRKRQSKSIDRPHRVLIVHFGKIGDIVCATPMFRAIKVKFPDCEVHVAGNAINREVLRDNSDVDAYYVIGHDIDAIARELRLLKFNFACTVTPDFRALALLFLAKIPTITAPFVQEGYSPHETLSYRLLRMFVIAKPHVMGQYAPRENLRLLEPLGITTSDTKKHLEFSKNARGKIEEILPAGKKLVGISPTAGNKIKEWGTKKFTELANGISSEYGAHIVIVGGPGDQPITDAMKGGLNSDVSYTDTVGKLSIDELKALISRLDVFIAVDTGPIYIAEAFNVKTVDIVGPVDENVQPPRGPRHAIVKADVPGYPFLRIMNARIYNKQGARQATEAITVDMVMDAFKKVYAT